MSAHSSMERMQSYLYGKKSPGNHSWSTSRLDVNYDDISFAYEACSLKSYINRSLVMAIVTCILALKTRYPSFADSEAVGSKKNSSSSSRMSSFHPGCGLPCQRKQGGYIVTYTLSSSSTNLKTLGRLSKIDLRRD